MNEQFAALLQKSPNAGAWTYVVWPASVEFSGVSVRLEERLG
jgi:hypothetical protein